MRHRLLFCVTSCPWLPVRLALAFALLLAQVVVCGTARADVGPTSISMPQGPSSIVRARRGVETRARTFDWEAKVRTRPSRLRDVGVDVEGRVAQLESPPAPRSAHAATGGAGNSAPPSADPQPTWAPWLRVPPLTLALLASALLTLALATLRRRGARVACVCATPVLLALACGSSRDQDSADARDSSSGETSRPRGGVEIREAPPDTVYFLVDHQGSPLVTTDASGAVLSRSTYLPYGAEKHFEGTRVDPHRFVGNEHDDGADLADFQARPYRPELGVFLAPDPFAVFTPEQGVETPSRLYPYAYSGGDPINRSDPNGKTFGDYLRGMFDQATDDVIASARAAADLAQVQTRALIEGRFRDFAITHGAVGVAVLQAPIVLARDVAQFGDDFAAAAFTPEDYAMGRAAWKPVSTAMKLMATVGAIANGARALEGCPCFAADTLVHTADGLRPISEIQVGELVLARDPDSGATEYRPVVRVFVTPEKPLVELRLEDDDGAVEVIQATPGHPFWVEGRGWITAEDLALGSRISTADRAGLEVTAAGSLAGARTVYNLEVHGFHTYFVGRSEAWVHNACSCKGGDAASNRVRLRKGVRAEIEARQPRNQSGEMVDPHTKEPLKPGEIDVGHKPGHEWRRRQQIHRDRGSTRAEVRDVENDPDLYHLEDRSSNRSHRYEK